MPFMSARNTSEGIGRAASRAVAGWLAWDRRRRANKVLFVLSGFFALVVTAVFLWASVDPRPGDFARYFALSWAWGLCAVGLLLGMAEYKTSPLREGRERGHLFILLYLGALLIVTRALNMFLYHYSP
jgi:hypothetical protein